MKLRYEPVYDHLQDTGNYDIIIYHKHSELKRHYNYYWGMRGLGISIHCCMKICANTSIIFVGAVSVVSSREYSFPESL